MKNIILMEAIGVADMIFRVFQVFSNYRHIFQHCLQTTVLIYR